jgi:hypothetical protein
MDAALRIKALTVSGRALSSLSLDLDLARGKHFFHYLCELFRRFPNMLDVSFRLVPHTDRTPQR